jgi:polysaccharide export outer membrane protein
MKISRSIIIVALCVIAAPRAFAQQDSAASSEIGSVSPNSSAVGNALDQMGVRKYLLGPGDILDLRVFGEPQFNDKLQVTDEGYVEVPFIGAVGARCRTDVEIRKDITAALGKYLKSPQVSLRITEARSRPPAVVFGAVRSPQRVQMQRRARLLELLAFSGGVTEQAGGDIQVFHTEPVMCPDREAAQFEEKVETAADSTDPAGQQNLSDDPLAVPFTVYKISDLKLGKREANPVIRPGDIVIVGEATPVYITGAVISPQGIALREKLPITRAVAMVGGLRKDAKPSKIRIYRQKPDSKEQEILTVDFNAIRKQKEDDFFLQPYDVVEVPDDTGFKKTILDVLKGTVPNATSSIATGLPYRILY